MIQYMSSFIFLSLLEVFLESLSFYLRGVVIKRYRSRQSSTVKFDRYYKIDRY